MSLNTWQIEEAEKALSEADRGEFASDRDVQLTVGKWLMAVQVSDDTKPKARRCYAHDIHSHPQLFHNPAHL